MRGHALTMMIAITTNNFRFARVLIFLVSSNIWVQRWRKRLGHTDRLYKVTKRAVRCGLCPSANLTEITP